MPYYGYARQDRKVAPRVPISAKLVADLMTTAGASRVLTMDLHAGQIQGFFNIPVDNLYATPVLLAVHPRARGRGTRWPWCRPDAGGVERARAVRQAARCWPGDHRQAARRPQRSRRDAHHRRGDELLGDSRRRHRRHGGHDRHRRRRPAGGRRAGASSRCCTHGVLSGPAIERLEVVGDRRSWSSPTPFRWVGSRPERAKMHVRSRWRT